MKRTRGISRRDFMKGVGVAAASATLPTFHVLGQNEGLSGNLRILQWSHFVPQYDRWFDAFAQRWGEANGVNVTVDHINLTEIPATTAAEISAGEGHDLIEYLTPPSNLEPSVLDLTDVNEEAVQRFGPQIGLATSSTFNPTTGKYYGFCHSWVPDPGNYRIQMWTDIGMPNGPSTWQDLLDGGARIREEMGIQMGIGMSNELDSNMACRALMWAFGAAEQDASENVTVNSPQTIEALNFMKELYERTMTPEVFSWVPASNNQLLIAGQASYILNSISAYRTLQDVDAATSDDVGFVKPLDGPGGAGKASEHVIPIYIVPNHAQNPDAAKRFMMHLTANSNQLVFNAKLYNFPSFFDTTPQLLEEGGWLDIDPFGSRPGNKLQILRDAESWSTVIGDPGPANPAIGEVFGTFVIPQMFAKVARGDMSAEDAAAEAESLMVPIFDRWRSEGLLGGAS